MKCKTCEVEIPGKNGKHFYGQFGVEGVQCEPCAISDYKRNTPQWRRLPLLKNPLVVNVDCKS